MDLSLESKQKQLVNYSSQCAHLVYQVLPINLLIGKQRTYSFGKVDNGHDCGVGSLRQTLRDSMQSESGELTSPNTDKESGHFLVKQESELCSEM